MKKLTSIIASLLFAFGVVSNSEAAFPTNMACTTVDIAKVTGGYDSFRYKWIGQNNQQVKMWFTNSQGPVFTFAASDVVRARINRDGTIYVDITNCTTTVGTNYMTFSISRTNLPPNNSYNAEVWMYAGAATNDARTIAQGIVTISQSLYDDTNAFPFPTGITNMTDYLLITNAAATYATLANVPTNAVTVNATSNYATWTGGGMLTIGINTNVAAGDITGVTVSGGFLTGGTNAGTADINLSTGALSAVYASNSAVIAATQSTYQAHVTNAAQTVDIANLYTSNAAAWRTDGANAPTATMNGGGRAFTNLASMRGPTYGYYDLAGNQIYDRTGGVDYKVFDLHFRGAYSYLTDVLMFSWATAGLVDFHANEIRTTGYLTGKVKNGAVSNAPVNVQQMNASNAVLSSSINAAITTNIQQTAAILALSNKTITAGSGLLGGGTNTSISADYQTLDARYLVGSTNVFSELYVANRDVLGSEIVVNGNFATNTFGWTNSNFTYLSSPGLMLLIYAATNTGYVTPSNVLAITSNRTYLLSYAYYNNSTGVTITAIMGGKTNSYFTSTISGGMITNSYLVGVKTFENLRVNVTLGSGSMYLDDISVKPIEGGNIWANEVNAENLLIVGTPTDGRHAITKAMFDAAIIAGSNIAAWATTPAMQAVDMDSYRITELGDATATNDATTLQQLINATSTIYNVVGADATFASNQLVLRSSVWNTASADATTLTGRIFVTATGTGIGSGGLAATNLDIYQAGGNPAIRLTDPRNSGAWTPGTAIGTVEYLGSDLSGPGMGIRGYIKTIIDNASGTSYSLSLGTSSNAAVAEALRIYGDGNAVLAGRLMGRDAVATNEFPTFNQLNASNALYALATTYNALTNSIRATNDAVTSTTASLLTNVDARLPTLTYQAFTNTVRASNDAFTATDADLLTNVNARVPTLTYNALTNAVRATNDYFTAWNTGLNTSNNSFYIAITNLQAGSNANWAPVIGGLQLTNGFVITNLLAFNQPVTNGSIAITGNTAYVTFPQGSIYFGTNGSGTGEAPWIYSTNTLVGPVLVPSADVNMPPGNWVWTKVVQYGPIVVPSSSNLLYSLQYSVQIKGTGVINPLASVISLLLTGNDTNSTMSTGGIIGYLPVSTAYTNLVGSFVTPGIGGQPLYWVTVSAYQQLTAPKSNLNVTLSNVWFQATGTSW